VEILPCPFCGGKCRVSGKRKGINRRTGTLYYVICNKCKARGPLVSGKTVEFENGAYIGGQTIECEETIRAWNHR